MNRNRLPTHFLFLEIATQEYILSALDWSVSMGICASVDSLAWNLMIFHIYNVSLLRILTSIWGLHLWATWDKSRQCSWDSIVVTKGRAIWFLKIKENKAQVHDSLAGHHEVIISYLVIGESPPWNFVKCSRTKQQAYQNKMLLLNWKLLK